MTPKNEQNLERQQLTTLVNSMADAVIAVDQDVRVVLYNAATLNIFDSNNIVIGSALADIFKPVDADNQPKDITELVRGATTPYASRDLRIQYDDKSFVNLYISIAPVHLGYGEAGTGGFVILLRDITREKSLEEERDEFISVVSHELRTPIAIAEGNIGNAEFIVSKSGDPDAIKKALQEAHSQVIFLADMINDLSTLSRAERGKLEIAIEQIDVAKLVSELVSNYTPQAAQKGLSMHADVAENVGELASSKLYVREILQNFITNAIKYTSEGSVSIQVKPIEKGVEFAVTDTGIGISKADQERVYDKFFRSEDYRTRQANGTGLGLYVTMKLTRLIHAEIELKSELNKGSTFTICIPHLS